jgi:hypothetical protein
MVAKQGGETHLVRVCDSVEGKGDQHLLILQERRLFLCLTESRESLVSQGTRCFGETGRTELLPEHAQVACAIRPLGRHGLGTS